MVKTYPRLIASGKKVLKSSGVYKKTKCEEWRRANSGNNTTLLVLNLWHTKAENKTVSSGQPNVTCVGMSENVT